ncbi:protein OXIDATIVE STRESS 3 LIKE 2 isoform X1 [Solanum lycopersicum]|uniref:protein OXIDATIVE STRESS 3 LIKE 2 isoform X1 n=1 Tax=Solanum lycopersicum TaxID=4081 RepID=UPI0037495604
MSIVLGRNNSSDHRIKPSGFTAHEMTSMPIYNSPEFGIGDPRDDRSSSFSSSSSSSSIGRNSDDSPAGRSSSDGDGEEVQSSFKPGGLDNLGTLEEVLPIKRSISKFYAGKSKSFTSLADAASISSVKEIVKPEDAYTRKRKNLLAHNNFFGKNRSYLPGMGNRGIYKRPINSRSSSALAASVSCSDSSESLNSSPSSPCLTRPPLPPQTRRYRNESSLSPPDRKLNAWRSFSLSDLQGAAAAAPSLMGIKE